MPYGTVNLIHGVPYGETPITCTAGVGTYLVEFGALSRLTGDPIYEKVCFSLELPCHKTIINYLLKKIGIQSLELWGSNMFRKFVTGFNT